MLIETANPFNQLPVKVNKVAGTDLLWRDHHASRTNQLSNNQFVENYSWVADSEFFKNKSRVQRDTFKTMSAERYGGFGLGLNGGGARVVNNGECQIKGVGANALAGDGALTSHSYGGLDIQGAVKEIIYSRVLQKLSPVGVQAIDGLIFLDENSALHNGNAAPSVLMVREPITRPAHFLPCVNFKPKPEHRDTLPSDYSRILGIYKSLGTQSLLSDFYAFIQNFLEKCADQMSFFRMARISHNALTPSNIGIDGRVLDTALSSFIASGSNYGQVTSFLEEPLTPAIVAREWFYLIRKYLNDQPVEEHFLQLYEEKFYQYAAINMGFIVGLDREMSTKFSSSNEWRKVASRLLSLLSTGSPAKSTTLPTVDSVDFVNDILTSSLFSILHDRDVSQKSNYLAGFKADLNTLADLLAESLGWQGQSKKSFKIQLTIQILKRAILSSFYYITYVGFNVDELYSRGAIGSTSAIIEAYDKVGNWIYEDLISGSCTLFAHNELSISYDSTNDVFIFQDSNGTESKSLEMEDFEKFLTHNRESLYIQGYDFYPYLISLGALISGKAEHSFNGVRNVFC